MKFLIFSTFLFTFVSALELPCDVSYGIFCKVIGEDLTNETSVTFDVGGPLHGDITTVTLQFCKMTDVPRGIFESFPKLSNLIMRGNDLMEWKSEYLVGAEKLRFIYVTESFITHLNDGAFIEAPNLRSIAFTHNKIVQIAPGAFAGLNIIEDLQLNGNQIGLNLRADLFNDVSYILKYLSLAENEIEEFPEGFFTGFRDLEQLNIKKNKLKEIDVKNLPATLTKLDVDDKVKVHNVPSRLEFLNTFKKRKITDEL